MHHSFAIFLHGFATEELRPPTTLTEGAETLAHGVRNSSTLENVMTRRALEQLESESKSINIIININKVKNIKRQAKPTNSIFNRPKKQQQLLRSGVRFAEGTEKQT